MTILSVYFCGSSVIAATRVQAADSVCLRAIEKLLKKAPVPRYKLPLHNLRDAIRRKIARQRGHLYPIVAIDELPMAYLFARGVFGETTDEQLRLLGKDGLDSVLNELKGQVNHVLRYPIDINVFIDQAIEAALQSSAARNALKDPAHSKKFGLVLRWPRIKRDESSNLSSLEFVEKYFANVDQIQIELDRLVRRERQIESETEKRILEQAILFKKLETYRHEILRVQSELEQKTLPEKAQKMFDEFSRLYVEGSAAQQNRPELSPPQWAWQRLKWMQFRAEVASMFADDFIKVKDDERFKQLVKIVKSLSEAEKAQLGLDRVSEIQNWWQRKRWKPFGLAVLAFSGGGTGMMAGLVNIYQGFFWESIQRRECVQKPSDSEFLDCTAELLKGMFKGTFFLSKADLSRVLNDMGEIQDPDVREEIERLRKMRVEWVYGRMSQEGVTDTAKSELEASIPGSDRYRETMIQAKSDEEFFEKLLSEKIDTGYLQFKYALIYSGSKAKERTRLAAKAENSELRQFHLSQLKKLPNASAMANDLKEILELRDAHKESMEEENLISKKIEEAVEHTEPPK